MMQPNWICKICEQTFTRTWNAKRHCYNKHGGILDSVIKLFASGNSVGLSLNSTNRLNSYSLRSHNDNFFQNNSPYHVKQDPEPGEFMNYFSRDLMLNDRLEDLAPKYEEIEKVLTGLPEEQKRKILGHIVTSAVTSENPVDCINSKLKVWRRAKTCNSMLNDAAIFLV